MIACWGLEVQCGTVQIFFVVSVSPKRKEHPVVIVTRYKLSVVVKSSSSDSVTHNTEKGQVF